MVPERSGLLWHTDQITITWDSKRNPTKLRSLKVFWHLPDTDFEVSWAAAVGAKDGHTTFLRYFVIRKSHYTTQRYAACSILHHHSHPWLQFIKSPEYIWDIYKYLWLQADMTFSKSHRTCITEHKAHFALTTGSFFLVKQGCSVSPSAQCRPLGVYTSAAAPASPALSLLWGSLSLWLDWYLPAPAPQTLNLQM